MQHRDQQVRDQEVKPRRAEIEPAEYRKRQPLAQGRGRGTWESQRDGDQNAWDEVKVMAVQQRPLRVQVKADILVPYVLYVCM